jgi:hypothetical protein
VPEPPNIVALFEDGAAIDAALARAAEAARHEARLLGRPLIVWQDGQVVEVPPDQLPAASPCAAPSTT